MSSKFFLFLVISLGFLLLIFGLEADLPFQNKQFSAAKTNTRANGLIISDSPFLSLDLKAKAAYVYDLKNSKEIFVKNAEIQLPLASLAKLMTAIIGWENLNYDAVVTISKEALEQEGDSGFLVDEKWLLKDLIDIMLVNSSNDASFAIAEKIEELFTPLESPNKKINCGGNGQSHHCSAFLTGFTFTEVPFESFKLRKSKSENLPYSNDRSRMEEFLGTGKFSKTTELMNKKAKELKMAQTFFLNSTGLDLNSGANGGYGSARDIFILLKYILENHPEILSKTNQESLTLFSLDSNFHAFQNTNQSLNKIRHLIGGKTGFTDLAGGNLAVIFDAGINHPITAVVLGSSFEGRFDDMEKLAEASYMCFKTQSEDCAKHK